MPGKYTSISIFKEEVSDCSSSKSMVIMAKTYKEELIDAILQWDEEKEYDEKELKRTKQKDLEEIFDQMFARFGKK